MAELADAPDLGSGVYDVQVQVLLSALHQKSSNYRESLVFAAFFNFFSDKTEQNILCYNEYSDGNEERKMHKFFKIANRILNIILACIIACCGNRYSS